MANAEIPCFLFISNDLFVTAAVKNNILYRTFNERVLIKTQRFGIPDDKHSVR